MSAGRCLRRHGDSEAGDAGEAQAVAGVHRPRSLPQFERGSGEWRRGATLAFVAPITWLSFCGERLLLTCLREERVHDAEGGLRSVMPAPQRAGFLRSFGCAEGEWLATLRSTRSCRAGRVDEGSGAGRGRLLAGH